MNEAVKPRFAIDLDEIERQLAQSQPVAPPSQRGDPLAELARIVGQEDPFHTLLGSERGRSRPQDRANLDDLFVTAGEVRPGSARDQQQELRSTFGGGDTFPRYEAPQPADHGAYDELAADEAYDDRQAQPPEYAPIDDEDFHQPPRSRKGLIAVAAIVGAGAIGLGAAFLMSSGSTILKTGEPPLIKATNEPAKVQPQAPGGLEIPNQNKQIYERAGQEAQTKVVNREEQPVDVRQAARSTSQGTPGNAPAASAAPATPAANPGGGLNLGEPRRVRTVSIRPDGTVVGEGGAGRSASAPAASSAAVPAPPTMTLPPTAQGARPAAPQTAAPPPAAPAPRPVPTATTPAASTGGGSPQAAGGSASPPTQQRVAAAQPAPAAQAPAAQTPAPTPAATTAPDSAAAGSFAVQLGVTASEPEARTALQKLQQKYADLGGQAAMIRKAEVNGNTVFRVRVGPMSREDASSLCSKIQGQGGQCFVAKN